MNDLTIETHALRKQYGQHAALDGIDLTAPQGSITALLGPNGAGKTTTVGILSTLTRPDGGTARVCGFDVVREAAQVRRHLSLTGQFAAVDLFLSGYENLTLMAGFAGFRRRAARARATEVLEQFDLTQAAHRRVANYSGGMRRRLDLAISLLPHPELLVLDEPTTGLDPRGRAGVWQAVQGLVAEGTAVLLTTQYLDEADALADTVFVLDQGRVVAHGTPAQLKQQVGHERVVVTLRDAELLEAAKRLSPDDSSVDVETLCLTIPSSNATETLRSFFEAASGGGIPVTDVRIEKPTLDDVFLTLTGKDSDQRGTAGGTRGGPSDLEGTASGARGADPGAASPSGGIDPGAATSIAADRTATIESGIAA